MRFEQKEIFLHAVAGVLVTAVAFAAQEPTLTPTPAPAKPKSEMRRAVEWKRFDYTCGADEKLTVYLHSENVKIRFKDQTYLMKQVPSADGGRYSDGKVVWWGVGNGGFLQEDSADGNGVMLLKDCKLDKPPNAGTTANSVTGTVSYLLRIALPPEAVIQVQLQDVTLADAPASVLAEEKIVLGERQVPVSFSLRFDRDKIETNHTYSVSARILVDGVLRFTNDTSYPVLTRGNPGHVDMILKQIAPASPARP